MQCGRVCVDCGFDNVVIQQEVKGLLEVVVMVMVDKMI